MSWEKNIDLTGRPVLTALTVGRGLEIGPGDAPWPVKTSDISYLDIRPQPNLENVYTHIIDVPENEYDFVLASHVLEHMPDAIGAIDDWLSAVKPGGRLLLLVPEKTKTFDALRPVTTFDHFLMDHFSSEFREGGQMQHLYENVTLAGMPWEKADWPRMISEGYLHNHVWTDKSMLEFFFSIQGLVPEFEVAHFHLVGIEMVIVLQRI